MDMFWFVVGCVLFGACIRGLKWVVRSTYVGSGMKREHETGTLAAQDAIECRMVDLITEWPSASAEQISLLMRDELVNARRNTPANMGFASIDAAARLQRTINVTLARAARKAAQAPLRHVQAEVVGSRREPAARIIRKVECPRCERQNRGDESTCAWCGSYLKDTENRVS